MDDKIPVLQRHKDEASKAFGVTNGSIYASCAQACANADFARLVNVILRLCKYGDHTLSGFAASIILGSAFNAEMGQGLEKISCMLMASVQREALAETERLVLLHWKDFDETNQDR